MKFQEIKKRKTMKSLQKEIKVENSINKSYTIIFKESLIKELHAKIEF